MCWAYCKATTLFARTDTETYDKISDYIPHSNSKESSIQFWQTLDDATPGGALSPLLKLSLKLSALFSFSNSARARRPGRRQPVYTYRRLPLPLPLLLPTTDWLTVP